MYDSGCFLTPFSVTLLRFDDRPVVIHGSNVNMTNVNVLNVVKCIPSKYTRRVLFLMINQVVIDWYYIIALLKQIKKRIFLCVFLFCGKVDMNSLRCSYNVIEYYSSSTCRAHISLNHYYDRSAKGYRFLDNLLRMDPGSWYFRSFNWSRYDLKVLICCFNRIQIFYRLCDIYFSMLIHQDPQENDF